MGAWLADAFYYVFGMSAWWWVVLAVYCILRMYRRVEAWEILNRRTLAVSLAGFAVVLAVELHARSDAHARHRRRRWASRPGGALGALLARGMGRCWDSRARRCAACDDRGQA